MAKHEQWQWQMTLTIYHGAGFGHRIELTQISTNRVNEWHKGLGSWKGLGIPEPVLNDVNAYLTSVFTEHVMTRYGIQGELPYTWAGEPEPF